MQSATQTFLFTDIVDSTRHLQAAGDDTGQHLFRAHHKMLTASVTANGGEELEWLGDGILAVFASAADAVRCAISIQQAARRPVFGARFEVRIGIQVGEASRRAGGYFGTPVVVARQLCDGATRGQILCSQLVAEMLSARHTFTFRHVGAIQLKGSPAPLAASEVVYAPSDPAAMLHRTPFVGLAAQLEGLSQRLGHLEGGRGSVVMLRGEAGIGKTRLLEEFGDRAQQSGALVLRGACYDGEWQAPYGPFVEIIMDYSRREPDGFAAAIDQSGSIIARIAPALLNKVAQVAEPVVLDKEEERFRIFDAVAQLLFQIAEKTPLVLMLDDLHWADRGTVAMLRHVAHFVPKQAILLVGAYRDAEVDRQHPLSAALTSLRREDSFEALSLSGLGDAELASLLEWIGDESAPTDWVQALRGTTDGNPLFIREVLLHLLEEGKILHQGAGWNARPGIDQLIIPEGVRHVIGQRLARLSDEARRLLAIGAAFSGAFSFDVAMAVAELDENAALSAIDEALAAQLLKSGPATDSFDFPHAMIRHTLYADLNPARRTRLHRRIAEEMERAWGERAAEHAAEVAYQFWRGGTRAGAERGVDYAIAAADNAEAACAHDEVVGFLRIAIDLLSRGDRRRPRLLARLGLVLPWTLKHEDGLEVAREAGEQIKLAEGIDAAADYLEQAARAMHGAGRIRAAWELAKDGLRHVSARRGLTWASLAELDLARADAEDPDNPGILTDSPYRSEVRKVLRQLPVNELIVRRIDPPFESRQAILDSPEVSAYTLVMMAGELRRGVELWQNEAVEAERRGLIATAMTAWAGVAGCRASMGDFALVQAAFDRALALHARSTGRSFQAPSLFLNGVKYLMIIATDQGWETLANEAESKLLLQKPTPENNWSFGLVRAVSAIVLARLGRHELALQRVATLPRALELGAASESRVGPMACDAAGALWLLRRTEHSAIVERALKEKVIAPDFRYPMRDARLSLARLCTLHGRYDEAEHWFATARTVLDEQGARPLRAVTDFDHGLMCSQRRASGDSNLARQYFEAARQQFQTLGMKGWLQRVEHPADPPFSQ